ncbi:hypothetical protein HPB52_001008 [Rhipicephalus sanguineus]|uniref:Tonsoku-like protein n=2 Tax=Rhipicephalus sanguineus TaxID=34632 RepID=A0A9D4P9J9_RHISA|nr:hypothetical protein HPB52_001008 [Rhipicephalus sanguineus]
MLVMKGRLMLNMGLLYDAVEDPNAVNSFRNALVLFIKHGDSKQDLCRCLSALANIHLRQGNSETALSLAGRLLDIGQEAKRPDIKCEAHLLRGAAMLQAGDREGARTAFKHAMRQKSPIQEDHERASLCVRLSQALRNWDLDLKEAKDPAARVEIHEMAGDALVQCLLSRPALKEYEMAVEEALSSPEAITQKKLANLYVSLAETCSDIREYDSALKYYRIELSLRADEPDEVASTKLSIARILQKTCSEGAPEVLDAIQEAVTLSRAAGKPSLELESLEELVAVQGSADSEVQDRMQHLQAIVDDTDSSTQSQQSGPLSDINLEDISEASDSDPEFTDSARRPRKKLEEKINTKGETKLHKACIDGCLKKVKELLRMGHSVNVRDYSGWQPLHEAANYGYLEIVKCLVEAGAHVSSPGMNGVTPLHDALGNGHLEVALYLLEKGARPSVRTAEGESPLDIVRKWKHENQSTMSPAEEECLQKVELRLKEANPAIDDIALLRPASEDGPWIASQSLKSRVSGPALVREADDWLEDDLSRPRPRSRCPAEPELPALVTEMDDWLEDDIPKSRSKTSLMEPGLPATRKRNRSSEQSFSSKVLRLEENETEGNVTDDSNGAEVIDTADSEEFDVLPSATSSACNAAATSSGSPSAAMSLHSGGNLSVRVRILNTLFLVPLPRGAASERTVGWLATEAAKRYQDFQGMRPVLRITLPDGALLDPSDCIDTLLHGPHAEVVGQVESWDLPPLAERYRSECDRKNVSACTNLATILQPCVDSGDFSIPCFHVKNVDFLFRALRHQDPLHTLDISGTVLTPTAVAALCDCLATLRSLNKLSLKCTGFRPSYLSTAVQTLQKAQADLLCTELDLSYNPIGSDGGSALAALLAHVPQLRVLRVESCELSDPGLYLRGLRLLEVLHVGFNLLSADALSALEPVLDANPLRLLDLSGCFAGNIPRLGELLVSFLSKAKCKLAEIGIGCCGLTDSDIDVLGSLGNSSLCKLDIRASPGIRHESVESLSQKLGGVKISSDHGTYDCCL